MKNLELKIYKNWNEICETMGWSTTRGNNKKARLKDLATLCRYHKEGNKFVIDEIYQSPLEKIDNRGKSEGSRNNYEGKYLQYSSNILENYIANKCNLIKDYIITTNKTSIYLGLINDNFKEAKNNNKGFHEYLNDEGITNHRGLYDIFNKITDLKRRIVVGGLNRLQKEGKIVFHGGYIIAFKELDEIREAFTHEIELISNIEYNFLQDHNTTKKKLMFNRKLQNELYGLINEALYKLLGEDFKMCFQGFIITNFDCNEKDISEYKIKLYKLYIKSIIKVLKDKQQVTIEEKDKDLNECNGWGTPFLDTDKWKPWKMDIMEESYITDSKKIIEILTGNFQKIKLKNNSRKI